MTPSPPYICYVGFDARELRAHAVADFSLRRAGGSIEVRRVCRLSLVHSYRRPTTYMPNGGLWDEISGAPMSTDHAIARFFVPILMGHCGWALFVDGDILCRRDIRDLFALADDRYAVQVVQHPDDLPYQDRKKTGVMQTTYPRKNWSSVVLWNCSHPAHERLTIEVVNTWPGRELHGFDWLANEDIGSLPPEWNYLVGVSPQLDDPAIVHYTLGTPDLPGHEDDAFADEWTAIARQRGYAGVRA